MQDYPWTALVTLLALLLYILTLMGAGAARGRAKIPAPAMTGDPNFERALRVQMNTLESLPVFVPALWLFGLHWGDVIAAGIGAFWIIGRALYWRAYISDPKSRSIGFQIQGLATVVLLLGALWGVGQVLLAKFTT